jgi:uncharacterized protein (DUF433 family)
MKPIAIVDRGRGPELAGTRITVFDVLHYLDGGHSPVYIAAVLSLSTDEVQALLQYIDAHKAEVMAAHHQIEERIARGNPPEIQERLKASRERLLAARDALQRKTNQEGANGTGHPG